MDIDTDISVYSSEVKNFVQWCDKHHLIFNVKKEEEIIFDPGQPGDHSLLWVHNAWITQVYSYKLGVHTDSNLSWEVHLNPVFSSIQPWLYFFRGLRVFGVEQKILMIFYNAVMESILRNGIAA